MIARRKGHTLLEVIAVIAVLVVIASISLPLIKPMLESRHKDAAADVIRARWSQARSKAINTGRAWCFECKHDTGKFRLVPETDEGEDLEAMASAESELPGDVKFAESKVGNGAGSSSSGWTKVATFMQDGSAKEDAEITIGHGGGSVTLKLHGPTGAVSTAEGK
jgi:prepilin-type N-terminal cleavage/methylation domain-containing protein